MLLQRTQRERDDSSLSCRLSCLSLSVSIIAKSLRLRMKTRNFNKLYLPRSQLDIFHIHCIDLVIHRIKKAVASQTRLTCTHLQQPSVIAFVWRMYIYDSALRARKSATQTLVKANEPCTRRNFAYKRACARLFFSPPPPPQVFSTTLESLFSAAAC